MKLKDSTIILFLIITWIFVMMGVLGTENEIARLEKQIADAYSQQDEILRITKLLSDTQEEQEQEIEQIHLKDYGQDYILRRHHNDLKDNAELFTDFLDSTERLEEYMRSLPDNAWDIEITDQEEYLVASLVYLEAGGQGCSYELQKAIATVFFNQMTRYGLTVNQTIYRAGAFSVASRVRSTTPSAQCRMAVRDVLENGGNMPRNVMAFQLYGYHSFGHPYRCIDGVYFSTM